MKNIFKYLFLSSILAFGLVACSPQEFDGEYDLGSLTTITLDQMSFDVRPTADPFTFTYTAAISVDAVKYPYTYEIRFVNADGNPHEYYKVQKEMTGSHEFIAYAGNYLIQLLAFTPNGEITKIEKPVTFAQDNEKVYQDDPKSIQFALTGGKNNTAGKEWGLTGGSGLGPGNGTWGEWWQFNNEPALFDDIFTFQPNSIQPNGKFMLDNQGASFMNQALNGMFPEGIDPANSFITTGYTPATDATWEVTSRDGKSFLVINKGFLGYAITPNDLNRTEYEILSFTPLEIHLKYSAADGNAWYFFMTSAEPEDVVFLTGGRDAENGKAWKLRPVDQGSGIIMTNPANPNEAWWTVDAGATGSEAAYDDILSFFSSGKAEINNNGNSYMNESTAALFTDGNPAGSYVTTEYIPSKDAKWSFVEEGDKQFLVLENVFPMYAVSPEVMTEGSYEVVEIRADLLHIVFHSTVDWNYYLVPAK